MWPFRKSQPDAIDRRNSVHNAQVMRDRLAATAKAERIPYDGDAFIPTPNDSAETKELVVDTRKHTNDGAVVPNNAHKISDMPAFIRKTLDWLARNYASLEADLVKLKDEYAAAKEVLDRKMEETTKAIKAWEAANAVYTADNTSGTLVEETPVKAAALRTGGQTKRTRVKK